MGERTTRSIAEKVLPFNQNSHCVPAAAISRPYEKYVYSSVLLVYLFKKNKGSILFVYFLCTSQKCI